MQQLSKIDFIIGAGGNTCRVNARIFPIDIKPIQRIAFQQGCGGLCKKQPPRFGGRRFGKPACRPAADRQH